MIDEALRARWLAAVKGKPLYEAEEWAIAQGREPPANAEEAGAIFAAWVEIRLVAGGARQAGAS